MMRSAWKPYVALLAGGVGAWGLNTLSEAVLGANAACLLVAAAWLALAVVCLRKRRGEGAVDVILAGGFAFGLALILKLPYSFSWHDLASYSSDFSGISGGRPDGHLGYIAWLTEKGGLPLMSPMQDGFSVFYNPPLYHLLQAGFMKLNLLLGAGQELALENLQVFTLVCAGACTLVTVDLLRLAGASERGVRTGALLLCAQPMLWIMGATLNNDILAMLCVLACVLFTVRWERSRRMRDIVGIALALGAGMAVKLNSAVLIPCIAMVFVATFFRDLSRWKAYLRQFGAFLALSVPEAVAWPLYHLIAFQMPLNYVPLPSEKLNVSSYPLSQRFGFPDWHAKRELFFSGIRKTDHNVWMQTLKTGLFDERTLYEKGTVMWYVSYLLLVLFAVLLLTALALFVRMLIRRGGLSGLAKAFLGSYGALLIGSYLKFCVDYPYVCTFNFRYVLPVLSLCALAYADARDTRFGAWAEALAGCFAALMLVVYGVYLVRM